MGSSKKSLAFAAHRVCDGKDVVDHEEGAVENAKNALLDGRDLFLRGEDLLPDGKGLFFCDEDLLGRGKHLSLRGEDLLPRGKHLFVFKHDALRLWKDVVSAPKHLRPNEGKANRHYEDARRRTNDFLREAPANGHPLPHDMPPGTELRQSRSWLFSELSSPLASEFSLEICRPASRSRVKHYKSHAICALKVLSSIF